MEDYNGFIGKLKLCVVRMYRSLMPLNAEFSYKKLSEKDVIQNHSRGNVLLQLGRITTAEEFEALRAKVIKYEF